ncbi:TOBE domain-containing protein, partial [Paenibacillus macerans]|uniref:TOBE domain-containing protein n=1 Tax=Paenibacillus macerans TaxID=44252 RepID=UPI0039B6EBDD
MAAAGGAREKGGLAGGGQDNISIRYESVGLGEDAAQLGNTLNAIVEDVRYGGTFLQYELRLDGEHRLTASVP